MADLSTDTMLNPEEAKVAAPNHVQESDSDSKGRGNLQIAISSAGTSKNFFRF